MTKSELMKFVDKRIFVYFKDERCISGILGYADKFSIEHFYHTPKLFYIGYNSFKASEVRKIELYERGK